MKEFNFNVSVKDLSGKDLPLKDTNDNDLDGHNAGKTLAKLLYESGSGDHLKLTDWSLKMFNKIPVQLDESDEKVLREFIKSHPQLAAGVKTVLIHVLDKAPAKKK